MCFSERRIRELEDLQTNTCHAEIDSVSHREYFNLIENKNIQEILS